MDIEAVLLQGLGENEALESHAVAEKLGVSHEKVVGATKSLECDGYVVSEVKQITKWELSEEGQRTVAEGSPEFRVWTLLGSGPMEKDAVMSALGPSGEMGLKVGMKAKALKLEKDAANKVFVARDPSAAATMAQDSCRALLQAAVAGKEVDAKAIDKKLAKLETTKFFVIRKGPNYAPTRAVLCADLTKEMLADGSWQTATMKKYTFGALGQEPLGGQLHPLLKVRQEFREIFLELGFQEMETQRFVDSSFWNFDALFVPQNHPARDSQDTFFVSKPETSKEEDPAYVDKVCQEHQTNYVYPWNEKECRRNVLRTHTTAVSAFVLYNLAQSSPLGLDGRRAFKPARYFSIDRVFRNEQMDRTHLCEFHQVEGFIVDRNLSLSHMMHTLEQFFRRVGIEKLRFKPAYNPYTEPSMEIFGYHNGLQKWMEVGNSGMFRPELLKPMGFDEDVTAIAWGLSLERPTMIKYELNNIHDLFGHKVDLKFIRRAMIARY